jgi:Zn-dependent peptidase ImmA (M78 family)
MFRELVHYFLHGANRGTNAFYFGMLQSKAEFEADAMATIALVPRFTLNSYNFWKIIRIGMRENFIKIGRN